jgi:hypothetical protein
MKMNDVETRLFENAIKIPRSVCQVQSDICLHGEAFFSHPLTEWTKRPDSIDAGVMPLLPLQTANLRHKRFGAAHLHAVYDVRNFHSGCLSFR